MKNKIKFRPLSYTVVFGQVILSVRNQQQTYTISVDDLSKALDFYYKTTDLDTVIGKEISGEVILKVGQPSVISNVVFTEATNPRTSTDRAPTLGQLSQPSTPPQIYGPSAPNYVQRAFQNILDQTTGNVSPSGVSTVQDGSPNAAKIPENEIIAAPQWPDTILNTPFTPIAYPKAYGKEKGFRIGNVEIDLPVQTFSQTRETFVKKVGTIRASDSIKTSKGQSYETYVIKLQAQNGSEIKNAIVPLIRQISLMPFLSVDGGPFGDTTRFGDIPWKEIVVREFSVSTVPNQPQKLDLVIGFDPFIWDWYLKPTRGFFGQDEEGNTREFPVLRFDDAICHPLFELWTTNSGRSFSTGITIGPDKPFSGTFKLEFLTPETVSEIDNLTLDSTIIERSTDAQTLQDLKAYLEGGQESDGEIRTLINPTTNEVQTIIQVQTPTVFTALTGLVQTPNRLWKYIPEARDSNIPLEAVIGLVEIDDLPPMMSDSLGRRIPSSTYFSGSLNLADTGLIESNSTPTEAELNYITFRNPDETLHAKIKSYLIKKRLSQIGSSGGSATSAEVAVQIEHLIKTYQEFPYLYFAVILDPKYLKETSLVGVTKVAENTGVSSETYHESLAKLLQKSNSFDTQNNLVITPDDTDISISFINGTKKHNIAVTNLQDAPLPIHQYMGGLGSTFVIQGICNNLTGKKRIEALVDDFDNRLSQERERGVEFTGKDLKPATELGLKNSFLSVTNEVFSLLGVNFAMPVNVSFEPYEGVPGAFQFTLVLEEYDPRTLNIERLRLLKTYSQSLALPYKYAQLAAEAIHPTVQSARDFFSLQDSLRYTEVYPDLLLPTQTKVNTWVKQLKNAAIAIKNNRIPTPEECPEEVYNVAKKYVGNGFDFNLDAMVGWEDTDYSDNGLYCDPDFFVARTAESSFQNILDSVLKRTTGERNGLSGSDPIQGFVRLRDPKFGVTTIMPPSANSATTQTGKDEYDTMQANTFHSETSEPATDLAQAEKEFGESADTAGKELQWWGVSDGLSNVAGFKLADVNIKLFETPGLQAPTNYTIPIDDLGQENSPTKSPVQNFPEPVREYFTVNWRGRMLDLAMSRGFSAGNVGATYLGYKFSDEAWVLNDFAMDFQFRPETPMIGEFANMLKGDVAREVFGLERVNHVRKISLSDIVKERLGFNERSPSQLGFYTPLTRQQAFDWGQELRGLGQAFFGIIDPVQTADPNTVGATARMPYLDRVFAVNANFGARLSNNTVQTLPNLSGSVYERVKQSYEYFDYVGAKFNVDPHLLRAYFIVRSQMGSTNQPFAGLDPEIAEANLTKPEQIDFIAKTLKGYLTKLNNSPTLALLALDLAVTDKRDASTSTNGVPLALESLIQGSSTLDAVSIQTLVKTHGIQVPIESYYVAWLELCRVYGPYLKGSGELRNSQDPFFNIQNPAILLDVGRNNHGRTLQIPFSPTGRTVLVRASRADLGLNTLAVIGGFDANTSPEALEALNYRLKSAILPTSEDSIWGLFHQLRSMNNTGRLLGAFPAYSLLIVNEGFYWLGGQYKLWDQFYSRYGLSSLDLVQTRETPTNVANLVISNQYRLLTQYTAYGVFMDNIAREERDKFWKGILNPGAVVEKVWTEIILKQPTRDLLETWKRNYLNLLVLNPGARIQIRLGYGSNASILPIVFNGTILEANAEEGAINLTAVGDGHELEKRSVNKLSQTKVGERYQDGGAFAGAGKSPANMVTEALTNYEGFKAFLNKTTEGVFFRDWSHGIAHFGDIVINGQVHTTSELTFNIYDSGLTAYEQGVPMVRNYFHTTALYNWNHEKNYFSISVAEPTPWKVANVCRMACMDFTTYPVPVMNRSSLFFGKWWWPFNYAYNPSILDYDPQTGIDKTNVEIEQKRGNIKRDAIIAGIVAASMLPLNPWAAGTLAVQSGFVYSYGAGSNAKGTVELGDVDKLVTHMAWRPFGQVYFAHSGLNLIGSNIIADGRTVFTDAIGLHTYNAILGPETVNRTAGWCVDTDIHPSDRKTLTVDTGLLVTDIQAGLPGVSKTLGKNLFAWAPGMNDFIDGVPPTAGVENSVVQGLVDSVKTMYQGYITLTGTPTIKPHDFVHYRDNKIGIHGMVGVRDVIHRLDSQSGFMTLISPDCLAFPASSFQGQRLLRTVAHNVIPRVVSVAAMQQLGLVAFYKMKSALLKAEAISKFSKRYAAILKIEDLRSTLRDMMAVVPLPSIQEAYDECGRLLDLLSNPEITPGDLAEVINNRLLNIVEYREAIDLRKWDNVDFIVNQINNLRLNGAAGRNPLEEALNKIILSLGENEELLTPEIKELFDQLKGIPESKYEAKLTEILEKIRASTNLDVPVPEGLSPKAAELWLRRYRLFTGAGRVTDAEAREAYEAIKDMIKYQGNISDVVVDDIGTFINDSIDDMFTRVVTGVADYDTVLDELPRVVRLSATQSWEIPDAQYEKILNEVALELDRILGSRQYATEEEIIGELTRVVIHAYKGAPPPDIIALPELELALKRVIAADELAAEARAAKVGSWRRGWAAFKGLFKKDGAAQARTLITGANLAEGGADAIKGAITTARLAKNSMIWPILVDLTIQATASSIVDALNFRLAARQCVKIWPLMSDKGVPFVAGIKGHQGAVVGDSPGIVDELIMGLTGNPGDGGYVDPETAATGSVICSIMGIREVNYRPSEDDLAIRRGE